MSREKRRRRRGERVAEQAGKFKEAGEEELLAQNASVTVSDHVIC